MSALDKLFNKNGSEEKPSGMLGVLSSLIPPRVAADLQANVINMIQYFKTNTDLTVRQNVAILENQQRIMSHLGIEYVGPSNGNGDGGTGNASDGNAA